MSALGEVLQGATQPGTVASPQLAQKVAQAIALGMVSMPSNQGDWNSLLSEFNGPSAPELNAAVTSRAAGSSPSNVAAQTTEAVGPATSGLAAQPSSASVGGAVPGGGDLNAFLSAIRTHESGGDYSAYNAAGGASGAYQFIQSTWSSEAKAAGYGQYASEPAGSAPPQVQDAVAAHMASGYYQQYGNWADAAEAWYMPADVGKNVVPDPQAGNTESVTGYGQQIVQMMQQQGAGATPAGPTGAVQPGTTDNMGSTSAISAARAQLGVPYQWGGESAGKNFDCSGLVQYAYGQAGVKLPRTAQAQYDATTKIPAGGQLQPGDLLFYGTNAQNITHVGIYIGNGQMIDAPHTGADVRTENYKWADYVGATRPTDATGVSTLPPTTPAQTAQQQPVQSSQPSQATTLGAYYRILSQVNDQIGKVNFA